MLGSLRRAWSDRICGQRATQGHLKPMVSSFPRYHSCWMVKGRGGGHSVKLFGVVDK